MVPKSDGEHLYKKGRGCRPDDDEEQLGEEKNII